MTDRNASSSWPPRQMPSRWIICLAILVSCANISTAQDPSDLELEKIALDALIKEYKLDYHEKDQDGYVIDLRLQEARFDDHALDYAVQFKKLIGLSIARSSITDAGLEKLQKLKRLTRMAMGYTAITDRGLGYLEKVPSLRQIWAWGVVNVTDKGLNSLRKAVPDLAIQTGPKKNLVPYNLTREGQDNESRGGLATLLIGLIITLSLALGLWFWVRKRRPLGEDAAEKTQ